MVLQLSLRDVWLAGVAVALCACVGKIQEPAYQGLAIPDPTGFDASAPQETNTAEAGEQTAPPVARRPPGSLGAAGFSAPASPATSGNDKPVNDEGSDPFGVRKLYPTLPGGREWFLPSNAETSSNEWNVERNRINKVEEGVFHTTGNNGEVRLSVSSPSGRAWWRNVEMTGYFRYTGPMDSNDQERHWEFMARGERHSANGVTNTTINNGVTAPAGTVTWPGYPFKDADLNQHCLATSYHGNFYLEGNGLFEKEISHINGYASQRSKKALASWPDPMQRWFGLKYVVRNADSDRRVHLELWLDSNGDGKWQLLAQTDDSGGWASRIADLDGCTAPPFSFKPDQIMTWSGPWVIFRSDSMGVDFRALSAREITPLP